MADAKKCDRCGKLYEQYDGIPVIEKGFKYNIARVIGAESIHRTYDLCPDCMTKLVTFLNNESIK